MSIDAGNGRWTYVHEARKRPHVHPVRAPGGAVLTRDAPDDHPWHHALWFTIKYVNEENFWEEHPPPYGVLRHQGDPVVDGGTVTGTLHWIRPDRETVAVVEERALSHIDLAADAYAIDWDVRLTPTVDTRFDRTPFTTWGGYGGLALRGRGDWTDTRILVDSSEATDRVLGVPGRWCDLSGQVDGDTAGVLVLDHPGNVRHPVPWYGSTKAATYGDEGWSNFLNAAFLWDEGLSVAAGETLHLRYRVVVHDGIWEAARCHGEWDAWVGSGA